MKKHYIIYITVPLVLILAIGAYFWWQHQSLGQRQAQIHEKGSLVMPFDLSKVTHYFQQTDTGGVMRVEAKDPNDQEQIQLVRQHLQQETNLFAQANFRDPKALHGDNMPGLAVLSNSQGKFKAEYQELPAGAQIIYTSDQPEVMTAIHEWFMAQVMDHGHDAVMQ